MRANKPLLGIAGALILVGLLSIFVLHPVLDGKPETTCSDGSEYRYSEQACASGDPDARVSQETVDEAREYATKPKILRILGMLLVLGGIVVAVFALIKGRKSADSMPPSTGPPPAG